MKLDPDKPLTPHQRKIVALMAEGYDNKTIARKMGISHRTVEDHRANIFERMGVKNAVELVLKVHGLGKFKSGGQGNAEAEAAV